MPILRIERLITLTNRGIPIGVSSLMLLAPLNHTSQLTDIGVFWTTPPTTLVRYPAGAEAGL